MAQLTFYDADGRLEVLCKSGDPLEAVTRLVPWNGSTTRISLPRRFIFRKGMGQGWLLVGAAREAAKHIAHAAKVPEQELFKSASPE